MAEYEFPNPEGGKMTVEAGSFEEARGAAEDKGWSPSMGTFGADTGPDVYGVAYEGQPSGGGGGGGSSGGGGGGGGKTMPSSGDLDEYIKRLLQAQAASDEKALAETIREFDLKYGLDRDQFTEGIRQYNQNYLISQAGLTGTFNGQPTLPAQMGYAQLFGQWGVPNAGQTTLAAQQQAYQQQYNLAALAQQAQANPFRQQQIFGQANRILSGLPTAGFQAPSTVAGVGTVGGNTQGGLGYLQQILDDIKNPTANQTTADQFLQQTPTPNKIDSVSFLKAQPSTQNILLQAMQEKYGIDPNDALSQIKNTLPQFQAPTVVGVVKR